MAQGYILFTLIALPMATAFVLAAVPSKYKDVVRGIATFTGLSLFALAVYSFFAYSFQDGEAFRFQLRWPWIENVAFFTENGISFHLGLDGISAPMVLLTGSVGFAGVVISWKIDFRNKDFFILFFTLLSGVFGTFVALDLFFFFFFYELAVLPMYLLIGVWGASSVFPTFVRTKEYGAMKLTVYLVAASILIFVGILAVFVEAGLGPFGTPPLLQHACAEIFQKALFPVFLV